MTSHYLVDQFHAPVGSSSLIDVRTPSNGQSLVNGAFVVRVPGGVSVKNPVDLSDLLTKKYAGLLTFYAGFQFIVWDDMLDAAGVDLANVSGVVLGDRSTNGLQANGTLLQSVVVPLGSSPTQAIVTWECFTVGDVDPAGGRLERTYTEVAASSYTCEVSFDNGANYNPVLDGGVLNIPVPEQGSNFIIRFANGGTKTFIGSWSVVF